MKAILYLRFGMQVGAMPDQYPFGLHILKRLPDKMYPVWQMNVTVSPTAVPLRVRIMPKPVPGSPQPPA